MSDPVKILRNRGYRDEYGQFIPLTVIEQARLEAIIAQTQSPTQRPPSSGALSGALTSIEQQQLNQLNEEVEVQ